MYKHSSKLNANESLQLDWGKNFANFSVYLNGQLIGTVPDRDSLKLGRSFSLPGEDQRQVTVILGEQGLELWHNGMELLSGARNGQSDDFGQAVKFLIGFGIVQLGISAVVAAVNFAQMQILAFLGSVLLTSAMGVILLGLGLWARKTASTTPLAIALVLLLLNSVLTMAAGALIGLAVTGIMVYAMFKGIRTGPLQKPGARELGENAPLDAGM